MYTDLFVLCNLTFSSDQPAIPFCAIISVPSYPDKKFVSTEINNSVTLLSSMSKMLVCTKHASHQDGSLLKSGPEGLVIKAPTIDCQWCFDFLRSINLATQACKQIHGEQGWRSGESARLPPMCPGFDSWTRRHMWVEFVVGSLPCSEGFSPGSPVFLPPQKSTFLNSNSIWNSRATGLSVSDCYVLPSLNKVDYYYT